MAITQGDMLSLQSKGYFFTRDGQLMSNEGELQFKDKDGVNYTLRFGEVVYGSGLAVTAGTAETGDSGKKEGPGENRYLFITTQFDAKPFPEPKKPANTDFMNKPDSLWTPADKQNKKLQDEWEKWQQKVEKGRKRSEELSSRFAKWYYVISADSFDKLHLTRKDLLKKKEKK